MPTLLRKIRPWPLYIVALILIVLAWAVAWKLKAAIYNPFDVFVDTVEVNNVSIFLATFFVPGTIFLMMVAALLILGQQYENDTRIKPPLRRRELERRAMLHDGLAGMYGIIAIVLVLWYETLIYSTMFLGFGSGAGAAWLLIFLGLFLLHLRVRGAIRIEVDQKYPPKSYDPEKLKWGVFYYDPTDPRVTMADHREANTMMNFGNPLSKAAGALVVAGFVWIVYRGFTN
ncbi:hypothetical protein [Corynebacterium caspium]|uniref:hypothetical protein n=1 Tax=Corynebacterium caspium TaxID=234828 RepID=UPI00039C5CDB|nr:hypothetical protein [Corynebacterium caspium]WKD59858.1 hypothetical protein CCASP_07395 [Corynebacterium caspium DSM 44850]